MQAVRTLDDLCQEAQPNAQRPWPVMGDLSSAQPAPASDPHRSREFTYITNQGNSSLPLAAEGGLTCTNRDGALDAVRLRILGLLTQHYSLPRATCLGRRRKARPKTLHHRTHRRVCFT